MDVITEVSHAEKNLENEKKCCDYKVVLINLGNSKEIKYAENICQNKGESLIYGYHFGAQTRLKEKNNVKFDKRFDLSLSYEMITIALKQLYSS